MLASLSLVWVY